MILMTTKYLENFHRDSPLSEYSIAKIPLAPGSPHDFKMPFEQLFWDDPISRPKTLKRLMTTGIVFIQTKIRRFNEAS